ncbi:hypothetical protein ABZ403_31915, partial [Micromonospora zamorensis]|uniref:hypothetical protein n=1 Tax=Micromonospora zamorensis TaxID=709883 RepID=UPI0033FD17F5
GATVLDVPVDREGIDTASLERHPDVRAAYVTPAHVVGNLRAGTGKNGVQLGNAVPAAARMANPPRDLA